MTIARVMSIAKKYEKYVVPNTMRPKDFMDPMTAGFMTVTPRVGVAGGIPYHPHGEIIGFIGTNPEVQTDLGGEAELWIDDEKYTITKSFMAYFPRGLKHCPLSVTDIKRPVFHFDTKLAEGRQVFQWIKDQPG